MKTAIVNKPEDESLVQVSRNHMPPITEPNPRKVAYISGPMEGYPESNYPAFRRAEMILRKMGLEVLNPAVESDLDPDNPHETVAPRSHYLRRDIEWVLRSDVVVVLEGWEMSRGARLEVSVARNIDLPIVRIEDDYLVPVEYNTSLEEALEIAGGGDRQRKYGHPLFNMTRTAQIFSAILGIEVTAEQVALCMIGVKLARESFMPSHDNIVDIAGYALVYEQVERGREVLARGGTLPNVRRDK